MGRIVVVHELSIRTQQVILSYFSSNQDVNADVAHQMDQEKSFIRLNYSNENLITPNADVVHQMTWLLFRTSFFFLLSLSLSSTPLISHLSLSPTPLSLGFKVVENSPQLTKHCVSNFQLGWQTQNNYILFITVKNLIWLILFIDRYCFINHINYVSLLGSVRSTCSWRQKSWYVLVCILYDLHL